MGRGWLIASAAVFGSALVIGLTAVTTGSTAAS